MKRIILVLSLVTALMNAKEVVKTYNIDGMMCGMNCPTKVVNSIIDVEGVKSCDVSFENSNAVITFDDAKIDEQTIAKTIANVTYYKVDLETAKKVSFWTRLFGK
jgi:periplasmic mercuric ion binding protein